MAERGLPISTFVDISTQIVGGVARREYGLGLLVTTEAGIAAGGTGKIKRYRDIDAVEDDFSGVGDGHALAAARVWFGADSEPHALFIGRWATSDVDTTVVGTEPDAAGAAPLNAANGTFSLNGTDLTVDLSSATTYAAIATAVEAEIQTVTGFSGATFVYDATLNGGVGGFMLTAPIVAGAAVAVTGGVFGETGSGTDISEALGFDSGTDYRLGHATETLAEALAEMVPNATAGVSGGQAIGGTPTLPMVDGSCPAAVGAVDTRESLATFVNAGDYFAFIRDNGADALAASGTFRHYVFDQQLGRVEAVVGAGENFGTGTNYIDVAANAFLSSQRFDLPASIKNPHLKSMPGATALFVDGDQHDDLVSTRTSVYTIVGGLPSLAGGFTGRAGVWADSQYWLGWLKNELELQIFNGMRGSNRFSTVILTDIINDVMATAVRTGGVGLGARVNNSVRNEIRNTFNNPEFDGILPNGWIPWIEQPAARSDVDRENRVGRFSIWIAPSDAINTVTGSIVLSAG